MSFSGYTKLFSSILASTIWREPSHVRLVWITLLAMSDKDGVCEASIPGLADLARVPIPDCEDALQRLSSPDPYSRTTDHDGRRIEAIDGGWMLLNHAKYRDKMSVEERREYLRIKQAESRARRSVNTASTPVNNGQPASTTSTHTEAEATPDPSPKSKEQKNTASAPLIMSPKEYARKKQTCAFVGSRLEVPTILHAEIRKLLGGSTAEFDLMAWYADLNEEIEASGEAIAPDVFRWLKARYAKWKQATTEQADDAELMQRLQDIEAGRRKY